MGCVIAEVFLEGKALFDLSKVISAHSPRRICVLPFVNPLKPEYEE